MWPVTKLWNSEQGYDATLAAFDASVDRLGVDYLDSHLIHWPVPENNLFVGTLKAFAKLRAAAGTARGARGSESRPRHGVRSGRGRC